MRLESEKNLKNALNEEKKCILFAEKVETLERFMHRRDTKNRDTKFFSLRVSVQKRNPRLKGSNDYLNINWAN